MRGNKKQELLVFLIIIGIASFFRFYQIGQSGYASATIGVLTAIGMYLLVRELFEWHLAAIASFLLDISFWHVNFSRANVKEMIVPFLMVFAFFFLWRGIKNNNLGLFLAAGIIGGIGVYAHVYFWLAPVIAVILFINYWWYLKKDFDHSKYEHAKIRMLQGFALLTLATILLAIPLGIQLWKDPGQLTIVLENDRSIFVQNEPLNELGQSIFKTLAMFNFSGDQDPGRNIPEAPMLPWPIGIFFAIGFIHEIIHWLKKKHGHFSTAHTLVFAWFFIMLIPGFLSIGAPDSLKTLGALPAVMIFTAQGIHWIFNKLNSWYALHDPSSRHEAHAVTAIVMVIFLFAIGFVEYWRYFKIFNQ